MSARIHEDLGYYWRLLQAKQTNKQQSRGDAKLNKNGRLHGT